jgi:hypothetical protein
MKIIKLTTSNAVVFTGDDLALDAVKASGNGWVAPQFTTLNAEIETIPDGLPDNYIGSGWTYLAGAWAVLPSAQAQVTAMIAEKLASAKAAQWQAIKAKRDSLSETGGYKVVIDGVDKWFHSDAKSKTQQLGLVMAGAGIPPVQWKTMDGSFVTMSQSLAGEIFQAAMEQDQSLFAAAEQHNTAMLAAANPAAYDFSGNWPQVYVS